MEPLRLTALENILLLELKEAITTQEYHEYTQLHQGPTSNVAALISHYFVPFVLIKFGLTITSYCHSVVLYMGIARTLNSLLSNFK